jgi:signal transduction histidine kinase
MKLLQTDNTQNTGARQLAISESSALPLFSKETEAPDDKDETLNGLLTELVDKTNARAGFLKHGMPGSKVTLSTGEEDLDLKLSINDRRLLLMGKPLMKENACLHPIKPKKDVVGLIGILYCPELWKPLCKELVNAYAMLAAQNINIRQKEASLTAHSDSLLAKKKELEKIQEYNQNLLSMTTHDLSSPLNAVSGYLEMIDQCLGEQVNAQKLKQYYRRIQSGVNDVSEMLGQLNEVVKFKKGNRSLNTVKVDINWLVKDICELLKANAARKDIDLQVILSATPVHAEVDMVKFKRVIYNLVSNAIKYTGKDRKILVGVGSDDETAKVYVKDEGMGIAENKLEEIFEPNVKLNTNTSDTFSKGLGLYISSYFIEQMDGQIAAESVKGKGSTFRVVLPLAIEMAPLAELKAG